MKKGNGKIDLDIGLGGILKGLGNLFELARDLSEKAPGEWRHEGESNTPGEKGFKAVYGFSINLGSGGSPRVERFGNVRESAPNGPVVEDVREPMTDLFDEGDFILVLAEMPGVNEADVHYKLEGDILQISAATGDRKFSKELLVPGVIDGKKTSSSYKNGILELKLWKKL